MKENSLYKWAETNNPELIKEWDAEKNTMPIEDATVGSDKKVWWHCSNNHSWAASISSRKAGHNCPYCSNQKVWPGYNDLASRNPKLATEWDYNKNIGISPTCVSPGSNKKVWWLCNKGHSWLARIGSRNKGTGCPYCSNQKVLPGFNDLESQNPSLAQEWNYEKNGALLPSMITAHSNRKVWWKCKNEHEWINSPSLRKNNGCPYCSNQLLLSGYNDLATTKPEVLSEWDYRKNIEIDPHYIQAGSETKVWWKCTRGHSYQMQIDLKAKYGHLCPICSKGKHVSFPEKAVAYYIQKVDDSVIEGFSDSKLHISELDIYSPNKKIAIEYDGQRWHTKQTAKRDTDKNAKCRDAGITLYRIREDGCYPIEDSSSIDFYYDPNGYAPLEDIIRMLIMSIYKVKCTIDIEKDRISIYKKIEDWFDTNSASNLDPAILTEWDYEKNQGLEPDNFSINTHKKVWWTCTKCGGSWQASIANRNNGRGCPYCTQHKLLIGFNDLATVAPTILTEWDYDKNLILPTNVTAHTRKKVWWKCKAGHSYLATISNRVDLGRGCPICTNKIIVAGVNDIGTTNPELLSEWNYAKNDIKPTEIASKSGKKINWKCAKCGYEWPASPNSRTCKKTGCPKCAALKKGEAVKRGVHQLNKEGVVIQSFASVKDAAKAVNRSSAAIVNVCKGKTQFCAGYKWKYIDGR